jgi:hypothetical protein
MFAVLVGKSSKARKGTSIGRVRSVATVYGRESVHGREKDRIVGFSDLISGNPTLSADFKLTGPHTVVATTWKQPGSPEEKVPVTVDLQQAFDNLPPSSP